MEQVVMKPSQGSGGRVVGMGAGVVVVVGVSRIGGWGRLPWVRAAASFPMTVPAAVALPRPSSPLRMARRDEPEASAFVKPSNR
jgi:hypothetical protein